MMENNLSFWLEVQKYKVSVKVSIRFEQLIL